MSLRSGLKTIQCALLFVAILLASLPAFAQTDSRFSGTVLDPSGAVVPGATVVVKNERTAEQFEAVANGEGRWVIAGLKPSIYTITATLEGFGRLEYTGMQLAAGQDFALDLALTAAGVTEAVTVVAQATAIDLRSASIGVNVSEREVLSLPVNGRQMSQLMLQSPGSQNAGTGTWNDVRFSGQANQQNVIKFDGVEGSAIIDSSPGNVAGQIASPFKLQASLENVQEFRVESNNYPAEYGTGTGGQVNVVTKSGSNQFRGSVFEYFRNKALNAKNYFDSTRAINGDVLDDLPKSQLDQNQFGGSFGGPLASGKAFFFVSYEGYRLDAGLNIVEAAPSAAAWSRAVPAVAGLRSAFTSPDAVLLAGTSTNPDFDIYQLQAVERVRENSGSVRLDYRFNNNWGSYFRVFHDRGTQTRPDGVSGRTQRLENNPTNAIFSLNGTIGTGLLNELRVGYNGPYAKVRGVAPTVNGFDLSSVAISVAGTINNSGIPGQGASTGAAVPGGLMRVNSSLQGRSLYYDPFSLSFADSVSVVSGNHVAKFGGDVRLIRMAFDQQGGTTYTYPNVSAFMSNQASQIQYAGDLSSPSVFNDGASGQRHTSQQYYVGYAQDQWHLASNLTLNYGLRYDYYTPLKAADDRIVKFNLATGSIDPNTTPIVASKKNSFQPRVSMTYAPGKTVFRGGFGVFVGPGQGEDLIQPIESDRVNTTLTSGSLLAFPIDQNALVANFTSNPNNRNYQPRAYAPEYNIPERVYQYTGSMQRELGGGFATTAAYVGSQGRNLFLRSVANQITGVVTNPNPASAALVIREYSIVQRDAAGNITGVQNPYAEIDFKTSGGRNNYNAMMLGLNRRSTRGVSLNVQYTLGKSRGTSGGSNEADTAANNARTPDQFEYDEGYNKYDVRHTFTASMLYELPFGRGRKFGGDINRALDAVAGGWEVGGLLNARSGVPIPVQINRPDVLYRDTASGVYFTSPAAGREVVINTPGGGNSRNVRRPDLVPGVDPIITSGGLQFLNPAAFAVPLPGQFGNLERNAIHGPGFWQADIFFAKRFAIGGRNNIEVRGEVFNLFNTVNYQNPGTTILPSVTPSTTAGGNTLQPGQAYTAATAGTFGQLQSTVGRTVGLGTARQMQLAVRLSF